MKINEKIKKPIIFYDGFCNLCSGSVQFILRKEKSEHYYFASLQSDFVKENFNALSSEGDPESVILYENSEIYKLSDAALRISRHLKFPWNIFSYFRFIPRFLRDPVYRLVAKNRYKVFGKRNFLYSPKSENEHRFLG